MRTVDVIAAILVVIGGLNWGLIGVANFDLVAKLFGDGSLLSRLVYSLVGLAALFQALQWKAIRNRWAMRPAFATAS